uniref:CUB domain-containing protein n=1 Tax=Panagrolaimus sp. ES5 TaxID=591445 RepID=A0AC34GNY3_9BILA
MFTDDTQILHIRSSYYPNYPRKRSCRWQFLAPNGYGFKIVVEKFNVSLNTKFLIENDTDKLVNGQNLQLHHPYYNSAKWIQIYLSQSDPAFFTDIEFEAYITIVNQNFTEKLVNCIEKRNGSDVIWTNFDYQNIGYERNRRCEYNLVIKPNTETYVSIEKFALEKGVDYVAYYDIDSNLKNILPYDLTPNRPNVFVLEPYYNNFDKHVLFEFVSDGSVQSMGFEIKFSEIVPLIEQKIILSATNPTVIIDTGMFTLATIEISKELVNLITAKKSI